MKPAAAIACLAFVAGAAFASDATGADHVPADLFLLETCLFEQRAARADAAFDACWKTLETACVAGKLNPETGQPTVEAYESCSERFKSAAMAALAAKRARIRAGIPRVLGDVEPARAEASLAAFEATVPEIDAAHEAECRFYVAARMTPGFEAMAEGARRFCRAELAFERVLHLNAITDSGVLSPSTLPTDEAAEDGAGE